MNSTTKLIFVGAIVVLAVLAYLSLGLTQGVAPSAVEVPDAVNVAIGIGITALLTAGATWLFEMFGLDIRSQVQAIALSLTAYVVAEFQNVVNLIPPEYEPIVQVIFYALTLILAPLGVYRLLKGRSQKVEGESAIAVREDTLF